MNSILRRALLISTLCGIVAAVAVVLVFDHGARAPQGYAQSVYSRVLASGVIRCGYTPYPPGLIKDPNTGKITGVFADAITAAAANLGLKVQWVEEVGWGTMIEGLNANRYDLICSPVWANSTRAKSADFTTPLFWSGVDAYARTGDDRFTSSLNGVNAAGVRIATIDGEMSAIIAAQQFPSAQTVSLGQLSDDSQLLLDVADNKADVTFVEPFIAAQFLKTHPGSLQNLSLKSPLRVFPNTMMYKKGEMEFGSMLNVALAELVNSGQVDLLLAQYGGGNGLLYPDAKPYQTPAGPPN